MSNELTIQPQGGSLALMQQAGGINAGAVSIEVERAIAEKRGQMQLAKMFPRSEAAATAKLLEVCKSMDFAAGAFYAVPNRGSGPSIRFAEEVARLYGHFQYGHRELSRTDGKSEIEVFAWDVENNNYSSRQVTVLHIVDTKNGPKVLKDQADIDNRIANVASKQMRGRILALLPKGMVAAAQTACKKTLAGNNDKPMADRVRDMTSAFSRFGVGVQHLESYLGHNLDNVTVDELADLMGVFNALKEGAKPSEYFDIAEANKPPANDLNAALSAPAAAPTPTAAATPAASPAPAPTRTTRAPRTTAQAPAVDKAQPSTNPEAQKVEQKANAPAPTPAPESSGDGRPEPTSGDDMPPDAGAPLF